MFGFLHGPRNDKRYRQLYATCCSSLRDGMGFRALPFVSYEAIFACSIAVDVGLIPPPKADAVTCCKARRRHSVLHHSEAPTVAAAAGFSNALAMLLAGIKLDDDVTDSRSLLARLGRRAIASRVRAAHDFFTEQQADFPDQLRQCLADHDQLEHLAGGVGLDTYTRPTGDAFGLVYGILPVAIARACDTPIDDGLVMNFRQTGRLVGQALIAFDCAVDYATDRKRGHYNPLRSHNEVRGALEYSQRKLIELGWHLGELIGFDSTTILLSTRTVRHRVATLVMRKTDVLKRSSMAGNHSRSTVPTAFSFGPLRPRRGICDCPCDACLCDGIACDGCAGCGSEAATAGDCCIGCTCPCECCCDSICSSTTGSSGNESKTGVKDAAPLGTTASGDTGKVVVALTPYGTVRLTNSSEGATESAQSRDEPAKSDSGVIETGEEVVVIRKEAFGLLVRRKPKIPDAPSEP
ncbi:MAG: NfeD family protein [Planctomycetales bacterium]|nr:NfeD family protein [Planctomycetales bacterium]